MASTNICVIGIGNDYRGDDAIGLMAARQLRSIPNATVMEMNGETTALLDAMEQCTGMIVIDAMQSNSKPGKIHRFDAATMPLPATAFRCSTHAFSVGEAIELARALNKLPRNIIIYGIESSRFDPGSEVSKEVSHALGQVVDCVKSEIERLK